jgi:hypothetical protein
LFSRSITRRYAQRHRRRFASTLRQAGQLLLLGGAVLACTVAPLYFGWWDTTLPAAIGTAFFVVVLVSVMANLGLELIASVHAYFDRPLGDIAIPWSGGRALYGESARLDALAREAGLPLLSEFESADDLDTGSAPTWHPPDLALPTVGHLLAHAAPGTRLHRDLLTLRGALLSARAKNARFCLLVQSWGRGTNAETESRRRGSFS